MQLEKAMESLQSNPEAVGHIMGAMMKMQSAMSFLK
jgi:hypothetical protein